MAQDLLSGLVQGYMLGQNLQTQRKQTDLMVKKLKLDQELREMNAQNKGALNEAIQGQPRQAPVFDANIPSNENKPSPEILDRLVSPEIPEVEGQNLEVLAQTPRGQALLIKAGVDPIKLMQESRMSEGSDMMRKMMGMGSEGAPISGTAGDHRAGMPGFELSKIKIGPKGSIMPDFERSRPGKVEVDPSGLTAVVKDQFGRTMYTRPAQPNERRQEDVSGSTRQNTIEIERKNKVSAGLATVDEAEQMYSDIFQAKTITDRAIAMKAYQDFIMATLAPIVKSAGESGNLATEDIQRAQGLVPSALTGISEDLRDSKLGTAKFGQLRKWLSNIATFKMQESNKSSLPSGLPDGSTLVGESENGNPVYRTPDGKMLEVY